MSAEPSKNHQENRQEALTTPSGVASAARASTTADRCRELPDPQCTVLRLLDQVADEKGCERPTVRQVAGLCTRYGDRNLVAEAEAFTFYCLEGRGENRHVRDVARAFGKGWLDSAPSAAASRRRAPAAVRDSRLADSRARARAAWERLQRERAA
jgi:hypothetical protein